MSMTTWAMNHVLCDHFIEEWVGHRIRNPSRNNIIHIFWVSNLIFLMEADKKMHVRQTPLLKLNSIDHASHLAKQTISDIFEKGCIFCTKICVTMLGLLEIFCFLFSSV